MDENYLDNLLNEVSLDKEIDLKIEEELDNQIQEEKHQRQEQQTLSDEDLFNLDLEQDADSMQAEQDLLFSEEQMDELDQLDNLADLDIGDLDFSNIDFDDLDITKLDDVGTDDLDDLLKDFESNLEIDTFFKSSVDGDNQQEVSGEEIPDIAVQKEDLKEDLNEDSFDADQFLDSLLEETETSGMDDKIKEIETPREEQEAVPEDAVEDTNDSYVSDEDFDLMKAIEELNGQTDSSTQQDEEQGLSNRDEGQLDDLLSLLDLDDNNTKDNNTKDNKQSTASVDALDTGDSNDINIPEEIQNDNLTLKQRFVEVLFGKPDEDDILSEEELEEIEAKRARKREKKRAAKEKHEEKSKLAQEEKQLKINQKKKAKTEKKQHKVQKKARLRAEELANMEPEKKLNKAVVMFVFTLFLGTTLLFLIGTDSFNYSLAIERATQYFANQKYRKAYDEIVGVDVKEKDEDLKSRIYTVMYVERLYESYLNNMELERHEKALDSLLRGVDKYYEHYEEAKTLGVTSDMDYSFRQIQTVLNEQYGITIEQAIEINQLTNYEYVQYIQSVVGSADAL